VVLANRRRPVLISVEFVPRLGQRSRSGGEFSENRLFRKLAILAGGGDVIALENSMPEFVPPYLCESGIGGPISLLESHWEAARQSVCGPKFDDAAVRFT
jgi:hypothetical protein